MGDAPVVGLDLAAFEHLAWSRRTNLQVDPDQPVPLELIESLFCFLRVLLNLNERALARFLQCRKTYSLLCLVSAVLLDAVLKGNELAPLSNPGHRS